MLFHHLDRDEQLADAADRLGRATHPSAILLYAVFSTADQVKDRGASSHIGRLIACEAWTEAALELLNVCCPRWQLSRVIYDSGEWHCRLSLRGELPDWLGETVENRHEILALALLKCLMEASIYKGPTDEPKAATESSYTQLGNLMLCENFS